MSDRSTGVRKRSLAIVIDCNDLERATAFWATALAPFGYKKTGVSEPYASLEAEGHDEILIQRVPEPKTTKNRVHLDIRCADLNAEVTRLKDAGATVASELIEENRWRWYVMADPEGNEFCCLEPPD